MGCVQLATVKKHSLKKYQQPILKISKNFDYSDDPTPQFVDYSTAFKNNLFQELVYTRAQISLSRNKQIQSMKSQNKSKSVSGSPNIQDKKNPQKSSIEQSKLYKFYDKSQSHDTIIGQETFH